VWLFPDDFGEHFFIIINPYLALLARTVNSAGCGLFLDYLWSVGVYLSAGLSVCVFVTRVSPAKTAELIEMLFRGQTDVGPRNDVR